MTDEKDPKDFDFTDSNDFDFDDEILSKDFNKEDELVDPKHLNDDFDFGDEVVRPVGENVIKRQNTITKQDIKAANNIRENIITPRNTINDKEVERRAIAQAAFLAAREAEKKRIEDRLYLELRIVVETVKEYCEENDRIHWFEYILPTFTTLNKYGNRRNTEIMHELGNLITDITYKHGDDLHQVMPNKDALYIKLFASFIIDIAIGKL